MRILTRRDFARSLGALSAAAFIPSGPDHILYNANIITVDPGLPRAQAIALIGNRVYAIGSNDEIRGMRKMFTKETDIGGMTITPGFIDAHSHPAGAGVAHLRNVDCDLRSIAEISDAIRKRASETPRGEWVLGFKYDDTKTKEGRFINREDLDAAAPDHPVFIRHRGGHTAYVNSLAYKLAGVTESSPDPAGGQFVRDANGRLSGRLLETATMSFNARIPNQLTDADRQAGVKLITRMMAKAGVTSVTDAYGSPEDLRAYQDAHAAGEMSIRVYCMIGYWHIDEFLSAGIKTGFGNEWIRVGGMKLTCDGSISERTARLSQPFVGRPDDYGIIVMPEKELYSYAEKAHRAGWQIGIHANGDVGIDIALNVYERLQREHPRPDPRFRLEHCTVINPDLIHRIKSINAIPNPFSTYVYFHGEKMKAYGAERLESMFAVRSFLDAGIRVTQTSDYPPGPFEPMMALQSSVTRTDMSGNVWGPSQRITVEEAIRVGTLHGAYASFEEKVKGSLEPGKLADLVVLGRDPFKVDHSELINIPIQRTMVGGKWMYES